MNYGRSAEATSRPARNRAYFGFKNHMPSTIVGGVFAVSDLISNHLFVPQTHIRHLLPEPFDYFNHAGNFAVSMDAGIIVTRIAAWAIGKLEASPKATKIAAMAVGTLAVAGLNSLSETRLGTSVVNSTFGSKLEPNYIDFAYGMGAGIMASNIVDVEQV